MDACPPEAERETREQEPLEMSCVVSVGSCVSLSGCRLSTAD